MNVRTSDYGRAVDDEIFNYFDFLIQLSKSGEEGKYTPLNEEIYNELVSNGHIKDGTYQIIVK